MVEHTYSADLSPWYAILAHHWRHGGEPAKAIEYLEKAGRQAQAQGALEEAERFFREDLALDAEAAVLSASYYGNGAAHEAPDFEGAIRYALSRLERELTPELTYHNLAHTRDDVLPAARRLATLMGISPEEAHLLEIGAAFHDIAFAELAAYGSPVGEVEWYHRSLKLLREHRYFTAAARNLREDGKQKNIEALEALLR